MENSFCVRDLSKSYGKQLVLSDLNFELPYGAIVGVLGLNGVGKSTLFNCIAGFTEYKGDVEKSADTEVAYMPTFNMLSSCGTIGNILTFFKELMPDFNYESALDDVTNKLKLNPKKHYRKLSMGQKRIVSFVVTIYCNARVYLFDEPLINLDIIYRDYLLETMLSSIDEGKVYMIASHELMELENVFSHVMVLNGNQLTPLKLADDIRDDGKSIATYYKETVLC